MRVDRSWHNSLPFACRYLVQSHPVGTPTVQELPMNEPWYVIDPR